MFKCSWLHGSLLQAALQGAGCMHLGASLLLLLQLLSWEEASVDRTNGDQWRRTDRGGGGGGTLKTEGEAVADKERERERARDYLSLQEFQYRDRRGILIIMRKKNPKRERTRWVKGFGGFKTSRGGWLMKEDAGEEGSEGADRLLDSAQLQCWRRHTKKQRTHWYTETASLSAASTPTPNEVASIT